MHDLRGVFEQAVLIAAMMLGDDATGASIVAEVGRRLHRPVVSGAVHSTLHRLEAKRFIHSRADTASTRSGGRPRRYYTIDEEGLRALGRARIELENAWKGVDLPSPPASPLPQPSNTTPNAPSNTVGKESRRNAD